jgi:phosphate transport system protein
MPALTVSTITPPMEYLPVFQRKIRRLEHDILRMGALVETSCRLAHEAMFGRDIAPLKQIVALEKSIDADYRRIEQSCAELMTLASPVAKDLRLLSAFIQMVRDLERIGDYAQDLGEIAVKLIAYDCHPCLPEVEGMSGHMRDMLATSLAALADLDADIGKVVHGLDDTIDKAYEDIYQKLAFPATLPAEMEPTILLALAIRHYERMADHSTNVARRIAYIATGER